MSRSLVLPAVLFLAIQGTAKPAPPTASEIRALVEQLGSTEFVEREAAMKRLEELGPLAIEALRVGVKSENPETVRRAQELLRKAERRVANEKTLTPTLVELDAKEQPLDTVLAELSRQAKCEVVLGGLKPEDAAFKKITLSTDGKVPFWTAVRKVCELGDLQIMGSGGFIVPGAMPYLGRAKPGVRVAADRNRAVVLEARDGARPRPAAVNGAVLVEAIPFPNNITGLDQPTALLQAWPEPRLQWEGTTATKVTRATDAAGAKLSAEFTPVAAADVRATRDGVVMIRNADGSVTMVRETGAGFQLPGGFKPNPRQAIVRFKNEQKGITEAKELEVSLFVTVRTGIEPLCQLRGLEANKSETVAGLGGSELTVSYGKDASGKLTASASVTYEPSLVHPATVTDDLPNARGGAAGSGNATVHGVRIADADGKPYTLGLASGSFLFDPSGKRIASKLQLELHGDRDGQGPPTSVTFWGTYGKPVEVNVTLKGVPLTGGK